MRRCGSRLVLPSKAFYELVMSWTLVSGRWYRDVGVGRGRGRLRISGVVYVDFFWPNASWTLVSATFEENNYQRLRSLVRWRDSRVFGAIPVLTCPWLFTASLWVVCIEGEFPSAGNLWPSYSVLPDAPMHKFGCVGAFWTTSLDEKA